MDSIRNQNEESAADRRRRGVLSELTDEHPVWIELSAMLNEAQRTLSRKLADFGTTTEEATLYRGKLNHAHEFMDALEYFRKLPADGE